VGATGAAVDAPKLKAGAAGAGVVADGPNKGAAFVPNGLLPPF
jgi:hypothetical protein